MKYVGALFSATIIAILVWMLIDSVYISLRIGSPILGVISIDVTPQGGHHAEGQGRPVDRKHFTDNGI